MRVMVWLAVAAVLMAGCAESDAPVDGAEDLDSDGDGFTDQVEEAVGTDPQNATSYPDTRVSKDVGFEDAGLILVGTEPIGIVTGASCGALGDVDTLRFDWSIEAPDDGSNVSVTDMLLVAELGTGVVELDIFVFSPDGEALTEPTTMTVPPADTDRVQVEGSHGPGTYGVEVRGCIGSGEVSLTGTAVLSYDLPPASVTTANPDI